MTTTGERGIHVTTSPDGWRVEKGGSSSVGAGPRPPGILSSCSSWWQKPEGDTLKDARLVMEVAEDNMVSLVNTQNQKIKRAWGNKEVGRFVIKT